MPHVGHGRSHEHMLVQSDVADGQRGWCRVEYFIFGLYSEILAAAACCEISPLRLFAIGVAGEVQQFKVVEFLGGDRGDMPSQGTFTFSDDRERIARLEDQMISAFGFAVIRNAVGASRAGEAICDLGAKMLRDEHLPALKAASDAGELANVTTLSLNACQLISTVPDLSGMRRLSKLSLINCKSITSLPDLSALPALRVLKLEGCDALRALPQLPSGMNVEEDMSLPEHLRLPSM